MIRSENNLLTGVGKVGRLTLRSGGIRMLSLCHAGGGGGGGKL